MAEARRQMMARDAQAGRAMPNADTGRGMRTADYEFALPDSLIAQVPAARRDESRLMVLHRESGEIEHRRFSDLPSYLRAGDTLVLNTTRVFKARLLGKRDSGQPAEIFLLRTIDAAGREWEAMTSPGNKLKPGRRVHIAPGFDVEVLELTPRGTRNVRLHTDDPRAAIAAHGHIPLPPYIARADAPADIERYQTVFAREEGSVAAPTAGLHFTPELLAALAANGVERADVLLHVGAGTFKPVDAADPADHVMHEEWFSISRETAAALDATRPRGGRICAVGTTSLRTLESAYSPGSQGASGSVAPCYRAGSGATSIFIRPPHRPRAADLLVTNFHLPRSTLLMLVAATAGYDLTMHAYEVAVREGYRFYSYGDAMLIL
jgi:S-adenosylmethionine:tRNA ribosyltransferase-isomerase